MSEIIITDEKGYGLDQLALIRRLTLYDVYCMKKGIEEGDYDYVASISEQGKKGYETYTNGELYCEWRDCEAGFWGMIEREEAPYELEDDPIFNEAKEETRFADARDQHLIRQNLNKATGGR